MTRRALAILVAVFLFVSAVRTLWSPPARLPTDRRVWKFAPAEIQSIRFGRREQANSNEGGDAELRLVQNEWSMVSPAPGPAAPAVVADLLNVIALARWQRRVAADQVGEGAQLDLRLQVGATPEVAVKVGPIVAELEACWLSDGRTSWLVDAWVCRALDRQPHELRESQLFTDLSVGFEGIDIELGDINVTGKAEPLAGDVRFTGLAPGGALVLSQAALSRLATALSQWRATAFVGQSNSDTAAAARGASAHGHVAVRSSSGIRQVTIAGDCSPHQVLAESQLDRGLGRICLERSAVADVIALLAQWKREPTTAARRHPMPSGRDPLWIRLPSGVRIDIAGTLTVTGADGQALPADADAIGQLAQFLEVGDDGEFPLVPLAPSGPAFAQLAIGSLHGEHRFAIVGTRRNPLLTEDGLAMGWRVPSALVDVFFADASALRDRVVWTEDGSRLIGATLNGRSVGGPALDVWREYAVLRAVRWPPPAMQAALARTTPSATIVLRFAPPPTASADAAEIRHVIERLRATKDGCWARVNGELVELKGPAC